MVFVIGILTSLASSTTGQTISDAYKGNIYQPGKLKPTDSVLKVRVGDQAPGFTLPSVTGEKVSLHQYRDKKNVVLSFVPAAWTPVCSDQWPGYNIIRGIFDQHEAVLLGVTVDKSRPCSHGPTRWVRCGFPFSLTSGLMVRLRPSTGSSVLMECPNGRSSSSIRRESYDTLMSMTSTGGRLWRIWSRS